MYHRILPSSSLVDGAHLINAELGDRRPEAAFSYMGVATAPFPGTV